MKKIISLALAAAMVAGMAMTSFANSTPVSTKETLVMGEMVDSSTLTREVLYKVSNSKVAETNIYGLAVTPGTTLAIPLAVKVDGLDKDGKVTSTTYRKVDSKDIKSYRVKATWETETGALVDKITIENRKNNLDGVAIEATYDYYIMATTKKEYGTKDQDLYGKLELYKTSIKNADVLSFNYSTMGYDKVDISVNNVVVADDKVPVRSFEAADEVEIEFDEVGLFEVNASEQEDLYLSFNTKLVAEAVDAHAEANLDFVNFPGKPKFFRTGIFYLYADIEDGDKFIYKIVDGVISPVDATYDEEYDAFKFALKSFPNSFIISDVELDLEVVEEVPAPEAGKDNPDTGR